MPEAVQAGQLVDQGELIIVDEQRQAAFHALADVIRIQADDLLAGIVNIGLAQLPALAHILLHRFRVVG